MTFFIIFSLLFVIAAYFKLLDFNSRSSSEAWKDYNAKRRK